MQQPTNDPVGKFSIVDLTDEVKLKTQLKGEKLLKVNKQFRSNIEFQANYFFFKTDKKRKNSSTHSVVTPTDNHNHHDDFSSSQYDAAIHDVNNSKYSHKRRNTIAGTSLLQTTFNASGLHSVNCINNGSSSYTGGMGGFNGEPIPHQHINSYHQVYHDNNNNYSELNDHPLFIDTSSLNNSYSNDSIYTPTKVVRISSSYPNSSMGSGSSSGCNGYEIDQDCNSASSRSCVGGIVSPPPHNQRTQSFGNNSEFDFFSKLLEMEGNSTFQVGGTNSQQQAPPSDAMPIHRQRRASIRRASVSTPRGGHPSSMMSSSNTSGGSSGGNVPPSVTAVNLNRVDMSQLSQSHNYQQFKQRFVHQQPIKIPQPKTGRSSTRDSYTSNSYSPVSYSRTPVSSHSSSSDPPIFDFSTLLLNDSNHCNNAQSMEQSSMLNVSEENVGNTDQDSMIDSFENVFLKEEQEQSNQGEQDENVDEFLSMFLP